VLKNGKELKGLIVEQHEDRVILSTEKGEMPVPKRGIKKIDFDEPEQNFMQIGLQYEEKKRWGEALAYYEKALEVNPDLEDARKASVRVRNQFWTNSAVGPVEEIERRQTLYDSLGTPKKTSHATTKSVVGLPSQLKETFGMALERKEEWTQISELVPKREAAMAGLKRQDRLVSIDGMSLRYLNADVVQSKLLSLTRSHFTLEYERDCIVQRTGMEKSLAEVGLVPKLESEGLVIETIKEKSKAASGGLKAGDLLVKINGASTRYMPLKKIMAEINKEPLKTIFSVRRSVLLTRR
jgi:C-terminal processing protease CtpA/Prc